MKKEVFVTAGLCRIKDQIAEAAKNSSVNGTDPLPDAPEKPVSVLASLPEETRKAWRNRRQEYEHFHRDLLFRLHELAARVSRMETENRQTAEGLESVRSSLDALLRRLDQLAEPDEFSADFQTRLSGNCRELDRMRLDLIQIQAALPESPVRETGDSGNLFAELDSVTFGQLFRLGSALFLPLILAIVFGTVLIAAAMILTFRIGL